MSRIPELKLRKFDMRRISEPANIVWVGKKKTGKSFCIKDFLYHHRDYPVVTAISGSEESNSFYTELIPPLFIHGRYESSIVNRITERQRKVVSLSKSQQVDPRAIFIMDDLMYQSKEWINDEQIRYISQNGRHLQLTWILTLQYVLGIPPAFRTNIDYVFIMRNNIQQDRKRLFDAFCGMFPSYDVFCQVMDQVTEDYGCLVIHNGSKSNKLEDQVFWYRAEQHDGFRLCSKELWQYNEKQYHNDFGKPDDALKTKAKRLIAVRMIDDPEPGFCPKPQHQDSDVELDTSQGIRVPHNSLPSLSHNVPMHAPFPTTLALPNRPKHFSRSGRSASNIRSIR